MDSRITIPEILAVIFLFLGVNIDNMQKRKRNIPLSLRELIVKACFMIATVFIGLWCGLHDSYSAFYVATLVQAVNNAYDSYKFLSGYNKLITLFHILSFVAAILAGTISIVYFAGAKVGYSTFVCIIVVALSIPPLHYLVEILIKLFTGDY